MSVTLGSYLINSAYFIFGGSGAVFMNISRVMRCFLCIFMGYLVFSNSIPHISSMRIAMMRIIDPQLNLFRKAFCRKMCMYVIFIILMEVYYSAIIAEQIYIIIYKLKQRSQHVLEGMENIVCLLAFCFIMIIFHPCFFTSNFRNAENDIYEVKLIAQYLEQHSFLGNNFKNGF